MDLMFLTPFLIFVSRGIAHILFMKAGQPICVLSVSVAPQCRLGGTRIVRIFNRFRDFSFISCEVADDWPKLEHARAIEKWLPKAPHLIEPLGCALVHRIGIIDRRFKHAVGIGGVDLALQPIFRIYRRRVVGRNGPTKVSWHFPRTFSARNWRNKIAHRANSVRSATAFPICRRASRSSHCWLALRTCATRVRHVIRDAALRSDSEMYGDIAPPRGAPHEGRGGRQVRYRPCRVAIPIRRRSDFCNFTILRRVKPPCSRA